MEEENECDTEITEQGREFMCATKFTGSATDVCATPFGEEQFTKHTDGRLGVHKAHFSNGRTDRNNNA